MIILKITNMSCGHCQIKIKAELEAEGYKINKIDMEKNEVSLDTSASNLYHLKNILEKINYIVDENFPFEEIKEFTIWDDKLNDDSLFKLFMGYLRDENYDLVGFNEIDFGIIIRCSIECHQIILDYLDNLSN